MFFGDTSVVTMVVMRGFTKIMIKKLQFFTKIDFKPN